MAWARVMRGTSSMLIRERPLSAARVSSSKSRYGASWPITTAPDGICPSQLPDRAAHAQQDIAGSATTAAAWRDSQSAQASSGCPDSVPPPASINDLVAGLGKLARRWADPVPRAAHRARFR
jgi:hypothetical protein